MTASRIPVSFLVTMGDRDITDYVESCYIKQGTDILFREFTITFRAWHNIQSDETWNIWASYDPAAPKAELLIRNGIVPPDRQPNFVLAQGQAPLVTLNGYDYVWLAQRRCPRQTLVFAHTIGGVNRVVSDYDKPLGKYRAITGRSTLNQMLEYLGALAGINVKCKLPVRAISPMVIEPTMSYWRAMMELARPWAPYIYYMNNDNTLVFEDPASAQSTVSGPVLNLHKDMIKRTQGIPSYTKTINRVIVEVI